VRPVDRRIKFKDTLHNLKTQVFSSLSHKSVEEIEMEEGKEQYWDDVWTQEYAEEDSESSTACSVRNKFLEFTTCSIRREEKV
jgi:flagellar hook-basal body complex protein FliE